MMTVAAITSIYTLASGLSPGEETPTDPETDLLTRLIFPRADKYDPTQRLALPSYVTEFYKILLHLGLLSSERDLTKLISGRFNSLLSNTMDVINNEDYRGVTIRDGGPLQEVWQSLVHIFSITPISLSTISKNFDAQGKSFGAVATGMLGMQDAPPAAKRSVATNKAFELRRKEYRGKEISADEMEEKDKLKRAMYAYQNGDKGMVNEMLANGELSKRKFDIALTRIPRINNQKNSKYIDQLSQAFKGLTINGKIKVWTKMSDAEKKTHKPEMMKSYYNMLSRQDKSPKEKAEAKQSMKQYGLI
jgi:hypothetical protein